MSTAILNGCNGVSRFDSLKSDRLFPGRNTLYIFEVASALRTTQRHVLDLINEGYLDAVNVAGAGNKSDRACYRIPVTSYDAFVLKGGTAQ